ncbi:uncharacterized protein LOC143032738 [Oratosquilla oratoria]|uniref:uncharacterized protein LOC143032738 n=1 Tax=Oratosquilla oratoria TaxID=337810 RepID=UPI003F757533
MGVFKEGLPDDTETEKVPKGNEDIEGALEPEEQGAVALAAAQSTARKLSSGLLEVQDFLPLGAVGSKVDDDNDDDEGDVLKKESPKGESKQELRVSSGEGGDDMTANKSSALEIYAKAGEINVLLRLASQGTRRMVKDTQDETKECKTGDGVGQMDENVRESPQSPNESVEGDSVVVDDHLFDKKEENYETGIGKPDSCVDADACGTKDVAGVPEEVENIQRESYFHVDGCTERGSIQVTTPPDGVYRAIRRLFCESSVSDGDDSEEEGYAALKCASIQTIKKMQREEEEEEEIKDGWLGESKYPRLTRRETTGEKEKEMSKEIAFPPTTTYESRLVSDTSRDDDGDLESCSSEDSYSSSSEDSEDLSQSLSESETADSEDYSGTSSSDDAYDSEDGGSSRTRNFSGSSSEVTEEGDSDIKVVHVMRKGKASRVRDEGEVQTVDLEEEDEEEEEEDDKTGDDEVVVIKVVERVKQILETTQEELEVICTKLRGNVAADVGRDNVDKRERGGEEENHTSEVSFELSPMPGRHRHGPKDDHERDGEPKRGQGVLNIRYVLGEEDNPDIVKMEILPDAGWRRTLNDTKKEGDNTLTDMKEEFRETVHNKRKFEEEEEEEEIIDEKEQEMLRLMQQGMKRASDGNIKVLEAVKSVDPDNGPSPPKRRRSADIEAVESVDNIDVETTDGKEEEEEEKIPFVEQGEKRTSNDNIKVPETVKTVDPNNGHSPPKKRKSEDLETVKSTKLTDFNTELLPPERSLRSEIDPVDSVKNNDPSQPTGRAIPETKIEVDVKTEDSGTGPSPPKSGSNSALAPEAPATSGIALGEDHTRRDRYRPCKGIRLYNRIRNLNASIKKPPKCKSVQAKSLHWQCQCIVTRRTQFVTKCDYCRLCIPSKGRKQRLPFVHKGCGELLWRYQSFHDKHRGFVFCIACGVFWKM